MVVLRHEGYLKHIIQHCDEIICITKHLSKRRYLKKKHKRDLIYFYVLQIGECANHFDAEFVAKYKTITWRDIADVRNRIAHGYGSVDVDKIWNIVKNNIKPLKQYCESILNEQQK